jgi:hypothetical protein
VNACAIPAIIGAAAKEDKFKMETALVVIVKKKTIEPQK